MTKAVKSSAQVLASLWVGVLFCLGFLVAPYLFILAARKSPAVPNSGVAADLIGPLLYSSDVAGLFVATVLIASLLYLRMRGQTPIGGRWYLCETGVGVAALCASINYWVFAPRIKVAQGILTQSYGAFHLADRADPIFLRFNGLHQASTALFMVSFGAALLCLVCMTQFRDRPAAIPIPIRSR